MLSPPRGLPASMYALEDGADLRLCRLAMLGLGLAAGGRVLACAADVDGVGDTGGLQLVLLPSRAGWLGGGGPGAAGEPVRVPGVEFGSVHGASLALQHCAWQAGAREPVCSTHLVDRPCGVGCGSSNSGSTASDTCVWLAQCTTAGAGVAGAAVADPRVVAALAQGVAACTRYLELQWQAHARAAGAWRALGAVFVA